MKVMEATAVKVPRVPWVPPVGHSLTVPFQRFSGPRCFKVKSKMQGVEDEQHHLIFKTPLFITLNFFRLIVLSSFFYRTIHLLIPCSFRKEWKRFKMPYVIKISYAMGIEMENYKKENMNINGILRQMTEDRGQCFSLIPQCYVKSLN